MKKIMMTALFAVMCISLFAQNNNKKNKAKFGIRGGVSTVNIDAGDLLVTNSSDMDALKLAIEEANYGYHFGVFAQFSSKRFFIQPEVLFNSNSVDFKVTDLTIEDATSQILTEQYQYLDVPLMMGLKFKALRLQGGPVGHVFINNKSELFEVDGYEEKFETFTYGWQAGLGLDIWKFALDLKYEGNFSKFGDHIVIDGNSYEFNQTPTRLVATLGITF